jgi:protein TonB
MHGALALVIAYQIASSAGALATAHQRPAMMTVQFVPSVPMPAAAAPMPAHQIDPAASAAATPDAEQLVSARISPVVARLSSGMVDGSADTGGASSAQQDQAAESEYAAVLRAYLRKYFVYPDAARAERAGGTVELHLLIGHDGQVLSQWVQSSSGHAVLDASALDLIHRAQPLPPLPASTSGTLEIELPLEYSPPKLMLGAG